MKRWIVIAVAVVAAVVVIGVVYTGRAQEQPSTPQGLVTAPVTRQDMAAIVSSTGSVVAERTQYLSFPISGKVAESLVEEGATVEEGQVLARLDTRDLELSLRQAEAGLEASEATLAKTVAGPKEEDIAAARAAVTAAEAALNKLRAGPSEEDVKLAELNVAQAKNSLYGAQGNRDAVAANPMAGSGPKAQAEAQVLNAELAVQIAEINYNKLLAGPDSAQLSSAEAQLAQARSTLAKLLGTPSQEDIRLAEAQVQQAQVGLDMARARLEDAELTAPFAGYLASWDASVGTLVSPGAPVGLLVDESRYRVDVTIDETEIGQIAVGQSATLELDAHPGVSLKGRVSHVDLVGTPTQGIVMYTVQIELEPLDTDIDLKPLMTATVDIIVAEKEQTLVVPSRALHRDSEGIYVEVLRGDAIERVPVTTGLSDGQVTEILSGLEEGEKIVVSRPNPGLLQGLPAGG